MGRLMEGADSLGLARPGSNGRLGPEEVKLNQGMLAAAAAAASSDPMARARSAAMPTTGEDTRYSLVHLPQRGSLLTVDWQQPMGG